MKNLEFICDNCEKDLTTVNNGYDEYRITLGCQSIHNISNARFAMVQFPPLDRSYHFCNINCLNKWLADKHNKIEG